jgi:hypothetical protein
MRGLTPLQVAQREFARIDSQRLVESGETERYAVEMAGVVRGYLASVIPAFVRSATTREVATALDRTTTVPVGRLIAILDETDLIKFARGRSSVERAVAIGAESRLIVNETAAALDAETAAATVAASTRATAKAA